MYGCSGSSSTLLNRALISSFDSKPTARSRVVTGILRLRSTLTLSRSLLLVSNSSQAPRFGMTLAAEQQPAGGRILASL